MNGMGKREKQETIKEWIGNSKEELEIAGERGVS